GVQAGSALALICRRIRHGAARHHSKHGLRRDVGALHQIFLERLLATDLIALTFHYNKVRHWLRGHRGLAARYRKALA
ncbi:MAG: hypothetical protein ACI83P_000542, partial [Janthinobacterium sp.]